ncbi:MAG: hypothetical protein ACI9FN_001954 [Saprospiraceae bacterium]
MGRLFFSGNGKNAGLAVAMLSLQAKAGIFNEVRGRKRPPKIECYLLTIAMIVRLLKSTIYALLGFVDILSWFVINQRIGTTFKS